MSVAVSEVVLLEWSCLTVLSTSYKRQRRDKTVCICGVCAVGMSRTVPQPDVAFVWCLFSISFGAGADEEGFVVAYVNVFFEIVHFRFEDSDRLAWTTHATLADSNQTDAQLRLTQVHRSQRFFDHLCDDHMVYSTLPTLVTSPTANRHHQNTILNSINTEYTLVVNADDAGATRGREKETHELDVSRKFNRLYTLARCPRPEPNAKKTSHVRFA